MTLPGPNGGNPHSGAVGGVPNPGLQDQGLHNCSQDPGPPFHPHHVSARPVFYVHAPPPPPFLQYQWPMPFSYNPFAGFPGMGYGMVMPPFPPPPYMEPPAYILPQPPAPAVDYRRLLTPQVHGPGAPFQNPNQTRRVRPPHMVPVRETVNSEVQTEPTHRAAGDNVEGSLLASSDSGHGSASRSPSLSSSSLKRDSADVENHTSPCDNAEDFHIHGTNSRSTVKHDINLPHPTEMKTIQSCMRATPEIKERCKDSVRQENVPSCRNAHCNMWSVGSQDSVIPVCSSSQQENDIVNERRVSIPDILMSWGPGTPQSVNSKMAERDLSQDKYQLLSSQLESDHRKSLYQSPTKIQNDHMVADGTEDNDGAKHILSSEDSETLCKILKLPLALYDLFSGAGENEHSELKNCLPRRDELIQSLNKSNPVDKLETVNETIQSEDAEVIPHQIPLNGSLIKRRMNESIWSVESLAPFFPTEEWLLQHGMTEPEVIVEMTEETETGKHLTQNDTVLIKASKLRQQSRSSSSDSIPMSDSCLNFSTPARKSLPKKPGIDHDMKRPRQGRICSEKTLSCMQNGSSEPEVNQNPHQEFLILKRHQVNSPCSSEKEATPYLNSAAEEFKTLYTDNQIVVNRENMQVERDEACENEDVEMSNQQLCVPVPEQRMAEVSPSKGRLVDCGTQCIEMQCFCEKTKGNMEPNRKQPLKYPDVKKGNKGKDGGFVLNGNMHKNQKSYQRRSRGSEKNGGQQEAFNGFYGKVGKCQGKDLHI